MPSIGKADHDIVYAEYDIKAKRIKQTPRKIFQTIIISVQTRRYDGLRDHMAQFMDDLLSSDHKNTSVNEMWVIFKTKLSAAVDKFILSKMTKTKYSLPWIDASIRKLKKTKRKTLPSCPQIR